MLRHAWIIAGLLCAAPAGGQERSGPVPAPPAERPDAGPALSAEDAELVKDLAVLERMELLKNLELFEDPKEPEKGDQRPR